MPLQKDVALGDLFLLLAHDEEYAKEIEQALKAPQHHDPGGHFDSVFATKYKDKHGLEYMPEMHGRCKRQYKTDWGDSNQRAFLEKYLAFLKTWREENKLRSSAVRGGECPWDYCP